MATQVGHHETVARKRSKLYHLPRDAEMRLRVGILVASAVAAVSLFAAAAAVYYHLALPAIPQARWLDLLTFGLLAAVGPFGFYAARRHAYLRAREERFPDFLRDLAVSRRAGLTLQSAVTVAARGDYGALTSDIQRMADELSWNRTFTEALDHFRARMRTPLIDRSVALIEEASLTGGNVSDVLMAASRDAREIINLESERRLTMSLYTAIIYIAFLVYLGVAATLYATFVPQLLKASAAASAHGTTALAGGLAFGRLSLGDFRTFYFVSALSQAIGNGVLVGVITSGKAAAGLRHAFLMVAVAYVTFLFLA